MEKRRLPGRGRAANGHRRKIRVMRNIDLDLAAIELFCRKWRISEMCLFGSVLRDDFDEESDVDVLVSYEGDHYLDRPARLAAQEELSAILGRNVDWVNRLALSDEWAASWSPKPIREEILKTAQVIYARA